jgi:hypothetical protein
MKLIIKNCKLYYSNKITYSKFNLFKNKFNLEIQKEIDNYFYQLSSLNQYHCSEYKIRDEIKNLQEVRFVVLTQELKEIFGREVDTKIGVTTYRKTFQ